MNKLRFAIAGYGSIAKVHALGSYQAALFFDQETIPELVGVMSRTPKECPLSNVEHYTSLEEMVAATRPDFLDLCMPHHLREDAVRFAAERGLPIYCEKPLASSLEEAERLAALARDLPTAMAFEYRFIPAVTLMKRNLHLIGKLIDFRAVYFHDTYLLPRAKTWRMTAENGGGALLDLGVHMLNLLEYLLGPLEYRKAEKTIYFPDRNEVDEYGIMHLSNGEVCGTMEASRVHANEGRNKVVTLYGETGSLILDLDKPYELRHYDLPSKTTTILRADDALLKELMYPSPRQSLGFYQDSHTCSLLHFAKFLYTGEEDPLISTFEDGLAAQELLSHILE